MSSLGDIEKEVRVCQKCPLHIKRIKAVPGEGKSSADVMFVGEGPGASEDKEGRPFCGAAGKFLDELLGSIDLIRENVFITNVVKCRPPSNRDPEPKEVAACWPYLQRQIAEIKPKVIVTLGRHSMYRFFPERKISIDHGRAVRKNGQVYFFSYHPAVALYNNSMKNTLLSDFERLKKLLKILKNKV